MLSILIPVYNYDVTVLAAELHRQAAESLVDFEIIIMEDGSKLFVEANSRLEQLEFCRHIILPENIGRSAIRNKLADAAAYDHLLFLDCDAEIDNKYYIQKYLAFCHDDCVVLGGRIYRDGVDPQYSLLSKYGRLRERNDLKNIKNRIKYQVFTSPNFLISKSIFNTVRFDETIKGYGHEDTIFGIMLKKAGIDFKYVDNPVTHVGIEDNEIFILKTEKALYNLYILYNSGKYPQLPEESKILSYYLKLKKIRVTKIFHFAYKLLKGPIRNNLLSANPSLFLFDMYKLGFFCGF